jgi:sugar transferase (PEP-CTERM system associated)
MQTAVPKRLTASSPRIRDASRLASATFLEEDHFHQILALERKRAERSGDTSLLVAIENPSFGGSEGNIIISRLESLLESIVRETDIKGWYKLGCIIGVIFTELGDSELLEARRKILAKVCEGLKDTLDENQFWSTAISSEFLTPTISQPNNGHVHLKMEPVAEQSNGPSHLLTFGVVKFAIRQTWFLFFADFLFISAAHFLGFLVIPEKAAGPYLSYLPACIFSILQFVLILYIFDLYNMERIFNPRQTTVRILTSSFPVFALCTILFFFVPQWQYNRRALAFQMILVPLFLLLWRTVYFRLFQFARGKLPTVVIGSDETGQTARRLLGLPVSSLGFEGFVTDELAIPSDADIASEILGTTRKLSEIIARYGIKVIVLAIPRSRSKGIMRSILEARLLGVEVLDMPQLYQRLAAKIPVQYIEDRWLLFSDGFSLLSRGYVQKIKRILDVIFSALLLTIAAPLIVITTIAIRLDSPGPVFYKQQRVGKRCRIFTVHKFRSMTYNAEESGAKWAKKRDPRVTRVGRLIRFCRIDEIPQIWNVFIGNMSLVGPRPERPEFVKVLDSQIPYYGIRHTVTPGITGWAQIKYPYGASIDDASRKLEYDLYYIKNMSILLDLKILLRTIGVVLLGEGAR